MRIVKKKGEKRPTESGVYIMRHTKTYLPPRAKTLKSPAAEIRRRDRLLFAADPVSGGRGGAGDGGGGVVDGGGEAEGTAMLNPVWQGGHRTAAD